MAYEVMTVDGGQNYKISMAVLAPQSQDAKNRLKKIELNAAVVLGGMRIRQLGAKIQMDGKEWFFCPIRRTDCPKASRENYKPLSDLYPWLAKTTIADKINILVQAGLLLRMRDDAYKKFPRVAYPVNKDRANFYHVPAHVCKAMDAADCTWIYPSDAVKARSISAAVVMNFMRGITNTNGVHLTRRMMGLKMHMHPDTCNRMFAKLVRLGMVKHEQDGILNRYWLPEMREENLNDYPYVYIQRRDEPVGAVEVELSQSERMERVLTGGLVLAQ